MRHVRITPGVMAFAEGSALIEVGLTRVLCTASVVEEQPPHLSGTPRGWVTAEYAMLPRATQTRTARESTRGRLGGRTHEIQRLIGRSLRGVVSLNALGPRTLYVDCDVLQADGGTRTAAITGAYVAVVHALRTIVRKGQLTQAPQTQAVAAVSVGIVAGEPVLDLNYQEDSRADVDFNVVMTGAGEYIEVQGTAEHRPFSGVQMQALLGLAQKGIAELLQHQEQALR
jgi:ribonuclease PH